MTSSCPGCSPAMCIAFLATFLFFSWTSTASYYSSNLNSFVQTKGSQFVVNGHPFYVNGFNAYYLSYTAVDSRDEVAGILQQAAGVGLTLCRTWAFNDGAYHALQVSPGVYDESSFKVCFLLNSSSPFLLSHSFAWFYHYVCNRCAWLQKFAVWIRPPRHMHKCTHTHLLLIMYVALSCSHACCKICWAQIS